MYVYFYESIFFKQIYSYSFHICKLNNLKVIDNLYFLMFDLNFIINVSFFKTERVRPGSPSGRPVVSWYHRRTPAGWRPH
jgi:hypothetical protein